MRQPSLDCAWLLSGFALPECAFWRQALTESEQRRRAERHLHRLGGNSLVALSEATGKDEASLCAMLCQALSDDS